MTSLGDDRGGWSYQPFLALGHWTTARVDEPLWRATVDRLRHAQAELGDVVRADEVHRSLRAAALNTGALEGLHNADRGLTVTVVAEAAWQVAIDRSEGPEALTFVEAALEAFDVVFDIATRDQALSEAIIRHLHEVVTAPQLTYEAQTPLGRQQVTLPHGSYKTQPNHVLEPDGTQHAYAPPDIVSSEMARLVADLTSRAADDVNPVVLAAFAHHALVAIHPFADGNGRVARLLASVFTLRAASVPLMIWADQSVEYRAGLKLADRGEPQAFVDFVFDRTTDAINLMEDRLRTRRLPQAFDEPDEPHRRQQEAAQRLAVVVERALDDAIAHPPGGVTMAIRAVEPGVADLQRYQPFPGRRVVAVALQRRLAIDFVVTIPRDRPDVVDLAISGSDERRTIRAKDVMPELRDTVVEQVRLFVVRVLSEAAVDLLR